MERKTNIGNSSVIEAETFIKAFDEWNSINIPKIGVQGKAA